MEGVASEAASLAGHLKLGKYDNNHMTLSASTHIAFTEDRQKRFDAYGWHRQVIDDGNNLEVIFTAIVDQQYIEIFLALKIINSLHSKDHGLLQK